MERKRYGRKPIGALKMVKLEKIKPSDLIKWLDVADKIRLSRGLGTENINQKAEITGTKETVLIENIS